MFSISKGKNEKKEIIDQDMILKQFNAIEKLSRLITSYSDINLLLDDILKLVPDVLGILLTAILLWDDELKELKLAKASIPKTVENVVEIATKKKVSTIVYPTTDPNNIFTKAINLKSIQVLSNIEESLEPLMSKVFAKRIIFLVKKQLKLLIVVPMIVDGKILGVIAFGWKKDFLPENEKIFLNTFTNQVSIAIYNSKLFKQNANQIDLLKIQNYNIQSLYTLTSKISKTLNPNEVAQEAVDSLPQDGNLIGGILTEYNEKTNQLLVKAVTKNYLSTEVQKITGDYSNFFIDLSNEKFYLNSIYKSFTNNTIEFCDNLEKILFPIIPKVLIGFIEKILNTKYAIIFPVNSRGKIIGTITYFLRNKKIDDIQENERQLLNTYTNQIGIALENAHLYTTSQEVQQDLSKALDEIQNRRKFEQDMIDVMGHELRTPMSILKNALSFLDMDLRKKGEITKEHQQIYIAMGLDAARRESSLIETLLSATKADSKGFQLLLQKVDFFKIIDNSLLALKREATKKNILIKYNKPEGEYFIFCDVTRVQEIADNFLNNAIKYTEKGEVEITLIKENDFIWLNIKDSGIGISEADIKKLGQKFFRAQQYINDEMEVDVVRPGGTGLGLYVSFSLINIMDGKLNIKSILGKGSTFSYAMPIYKDQANFQVQRKPDSYINPSN